MKNTGGRTKYIVLAIFLISIAVFAYIGIMRDKKIADEPGVASVPREEKFSLNNFENSVLIRTDDGIINKVDIFSGKVIEANFLENEDFSGFSGLPQMDDLQKQNSDQSLLISGDKSKVIITITTYDIPKKDGTSGGSQVILNSEDFLCDVAGRDCQKTDLLTKSYGGLDKNNQKDGSAFVWTNWDSGNNLLFGHLVNMDAGDISPMYKCGTGTGSCILTAGYDSQKTGDVSAVVPAGSLSPSLGKFVLISQHDEPNIETGKTWELLLYDSTDLLNPKSYDLSAIIDRDEDVAYDGVRSVAWSGDEKKLALGTTRRIFMLDVESGGLSLAYVAPTSDEGDFDLDSSQLFLSPDASAIAFVDTKDILTELDGEPDSDDFDETVEDTDTALNVLKKIDLKNANKVTELLQGPGLGLK